MHVGSPPGLLQDQHQHVLLITEPSLPPAPRLPKHVSHNPKFFSIFSTGIYLCVCVYIYNWILMFSTLFGISRVFSDWN